MGGGGVGVVGQWGRVSAAALSLSDQVTAHIRGPHFDKCYISTSPAPSVDGGGGEAEVGERCS